MIRANPAQLPVIYTLAREVANAGLVEDALRYYTLGVDVAQRQGTSLPPEYALGYASELYLGGQPQMLAATKSIVDQLAKQDPNGAELLLLRWLAERATGDTDAAA
jgi:cytochrome c-type biogenesis protein CcmH/NrfG